MQAYDEQRAGLFGRMHDRLIPVKTAISPSVQDQLTLLQYKRSSDLAPILFIVLIANSVAMALAVQGELPFLQQFLPPFVLIATCAACLCARSYLRAPETAQAAQKVLRNAVFLASGLGLVAGFWCVSAFRETDQYRCVVSPVFIGLSALVSANCLYSIPRAAIASMVASLVPIVIVMLLFDDLGIRAMGVMLVIICALQIGVIMNKFSETIRMLLLQNEIAMAADTDVLTGLRNRRAFATAAESEREQGRHVIIAMLDLDGFKSVNDRYGHQAGDDVLIEVAARLSLMCVSATSIARIGGDEFVILFGSNVSRDQAQYELAAARAAIGLPFNVAEAVVSISTSIGIASSKDGAAGLAALLKVADIALYAEKALVKQRKTRRVVKDGKNECLRLAN